VAVATSAARDATNREAFLDAVEAAGVRPEVISGEREGYLTFLGVTYGFCAERILVVDVGGGSTELVLGDSCGGEDGRQIDIDVMRSVDVGSRRVTELFLRSDPPTAREIDEAAGWIADEFRRFFAAVRERPREMVAVAGTATTLAAIDLRLDPYDPERVHGYRLGGSSLLDILEHLAVQTEAERRGVRGLEPERAGVIVGGALILQSAMAYAGLSSTLVSEHDILYGMVLDCDSAEAS
jgi:exopolyphosphatase/guanosine-5'-triphosphate,3'-diphosphate pyrophosphatase